MICVECGKEFERARKSKRQTCSRACCAAFGWKKNPDKRIASIKAALTTPESRARSTEINNRRWAIPGARAKLSAWNRDRWADPAIAADLSAGIRAAWTPELRAHLSAVRTRQWAEDAEYRAAAVAGCRRSKRAPEARAKFSALLRARWQDPAWRMVWLGAMERRMADPAERAKLSAAAQRRWDWLKAAGFRTWAEAAIPEWAQNVIDILQGRTAAPTLDISMDIERPAAPTSPPETGRIPPVSALKMMDIAPAVSAAQKRVVEAELDEIARFIRERGVTRLPAAFAAETTAVIDPAERAAIAAHTAEQERLRQNSAHMQYSQRGGEARRRKAA